MRPPRWLVAARRRAAGTVGGAGFAAQLRGGVLPAEPAATFHHRSVLPTRRRRAGVDARRPHRQAGGRHHWRVRAHARGPPTHTLGGALPPTRAASLGERQPGPRCAHLGRRQRRVPARARLRAAHRVAGLPRGRRGDGRGDGPQAFHVALPAGQGRARRAGGHAATSAAHQALAARGALPPAGRAAAAHGGGEHRQPRAGSSRHGAVVHLERFVAPVRWA
mmetsp:Transcript_53/g.157  ORF Transcript_53/g.157 Transcript_53/m.157 type:complete len:221 (+) Transcript_53:371-1033(+)